MHLLVIADGDPGSLNNFRDWVRNQITPKGNAVNVREVKLYDVCFFEEDLEHVLSVLQDRAQYQVEDENLQGEKQKTFNWEKLQGIMRWIGKPLGIQPVERKPRECPLEDRVHQKVNVCIIGTVKDYKIKGKEFI